jgi:hypothetical protein
MDTPFAKYTSPDLETLDQYETLDEFETNGPFSHEQHDHEFSGEYESSFPETEIDQFSYEESELEEAEENFSGDYESTGSYSPLSELEIAQEIEHQVEIANESKPGAKKPEGRISWAKGALNRVLGLSLPDNNNLDASTTKAVADFQSKNNLPSTQKLDAVTERALLEAEALVRSKGTVSESAAQNIITAAKSKIEDWTKKAVNNKPNHILNSYRDPRKIFAFVLHHMAFKRWNPKTKGYSNPESYLSTGAHFCIMMDGRIIQLHAMSRMIWHGNCASGGSVAVEFEGNFPNIKGKWWINKESKVHDKDTPTQAQYDSGRFLTSYLKTVLPLTRIMAHRQSSKDRENDPGPDIWFNVGQWAIEKLGLSDGGDKAKCGDGNPILPAWRTWGNKAAPKPSSEFNEEMEEHECHECSQRRQAAEMYDSEMHDHESDYAFQSENEFEQQDESSYEWEGESDYESESGRDWSDAVNANRRYGDSLKWNQYYDKINDLLLPYSGMSNVSLGEEAFAAAVFNWQSKNGFTGNNVDGVIGPSTWSVMSKALKISPVKNGCNHGRRPEIIKGKQICFAQKANGGWAAYGGGFLRDKLYELKRSGKLAITDTEISMFDLVSQPESGGLIGAINSWDNMGMSMGFIQFTLRSNELVQLIKSAPLAFSNNGIELDPTRKYQWGKDSVPAIKNAPHVSDLKSIEWAKRFFSAGLEDDVIMMQIKIGQGHMVQIRKRNDPGGYLNRYNDRYPNLWAFIYESFNSRPAILHVALAMTIQKATSIGINDPTQFVNLLYATLKKQTEIYYSSKKYKTEAEKLAKVNDELKKVDSVYTQSFLGKKKN